MKKIIALLTVLTMTFSFASCSSEEAMSSVPENKSTVETTEEKTTEKATEEETEPPTEEATGNQEMQFKEFLMFYYLDWEEYSFIGDGVHFRNSEGEHVLTVEETPYDLSRDKYLDFILGLRMTTHTDVEIMENMPFDVIRSVLLDQTYFDFVVNDYRYTFIAPDEYSIKAKAIIKMLEFEGIAPTEEITEGTTETTATEETTERVTAYQNGMFKVGTDMEAGEYMLFSSDDSAYLCVSSDANQDDIIFNEIFDNNLIATFMDGEFVNLSDCMAIPIDATPDDISDLLNDYIDKGAMYKVGKNIPAGEYKLEALQGETAYYCVYGDSRHDEIIANDLFENSTYVSVSNGEYLLLSDCKIVN